MLNMRDIGMKINNMVKELKLGVNLITMALQMQHILEIFTKARKMERVDSSGKMGHIMKETL